MPSLSLLRPPAALLFFLRRSARLTAGRSAGRFATRLCAVAFGARTRAVRRISRRFIGDAARRHPSLRLGLTCGAPRGFAARMLTDLPLISRPVGGARCGMGTGLVALVFGPMSNRGVSARLVRGMVSTDRRVR